MNKQPIIIDHDSSAGFAAFKTLKLLLKNKAIKAEFKKRFRGLGHLVIYKPISRVSGNRCRAGFQPTPKLTKFISEFAQ